VNVITKCDIADKERIQQILDSEGTQAITALDTGTNVKMKRLTQAIG
jgi:hypothetical protein